MKVEQLTSPKLVINVCFTFQYFILKTLFLLVATLKLHPQTNKEEESKKCQAANFVTRFKFYRVAWHAVKIPIQLFNFIPFPVAITSIFGAWNHGNEAVSRGRCVILGSRFFASKICLPKMKVGNNFNRMRIANWWSSCLGSHKTKVWDQCLVDCLESWFLPLNEFMLGSSFARCPLWCSVCFFRVQVRIVALEHFTVVYMFRSW